MVDNDEDDDNDDDDDNDNDDMDINQGLIEGSNVGVEQPLPTTVLDVGDNVFMFVPPPINRNTVV